MMLRTLNIIEEISLYFIRSTNHTIIYGDDYVQIFNDFYDDVSYEEKSGDTDISGHDIMLEPIKLKARKVVNTNVYKINPDNSLITYSHEYQLPVHVNEGDRIDGRIVLNVQDARNVFGDFEFCIARVE